MTYKTLLADPRWQKKRLKIFERDGWKCLECGRDDIELHCHHENYTGEPWEAPDQSLKTLCAICNACVSTGIDFTSLKSRIRKKYGVEICKQETTAQREL